jgi:cobalt/nickel transport system permease protein
MHANAFDRYRHGHSLLHNLDARVKVLVTVAYIVSNVILPDGAWVAFGLSLVFLLYCNWLSGLGIGFTLKRSFVALPFALAAITAIFSIPGQPLATWHIGGLTLVPTDAGLLRFVSVMVRSWLSVQMAILLVAVTAFPDIIHALGHLYVPPIIVTIIAFLYRYLFVLTDEVMRLMRARQSRSAGTAGIRAGGSVWWRARIAGNMAGQLFLRSYERSDRIYDAMLSRGYRGKLETMHIAKIQTADWLVGSVALAAFVVMQVLGRLS